MLVGLISKTLQRNCLFYVVFLIFIVAYINENGMKKIPQRFWLELVRSAQKLMKTQKKDTESVWTEFPWSNQLKFEHQTESQQKIVTLSKKRISEYILV